MAPSRSRLEWLTLSALLAVAVGLIAAPAELQSRLVLTLRDAAAPLQSGARWGADRLASERSALLARSMRSPDNESRVETLQEELAQWKSRSRALTVELAAMREELARRDTPIGSTERASAGEPLVVRDVLSAAVLGEENSAWCRGGKLLRVGTADGVSESSLVLEDRRPLIDQGSLSEVEEGQSVLAGRCVVGRVARTGRWVSTVLPVTDPQFRGLAQIVRRSGQGPVFAAKGLLEGHADGLCRLRHVPATEAVAEGDEVYTGDRDANSPEPLCYGTIVKAEIPPGSPHWEIHVQPAASIDAMKSVQVVRKKANPMRMLAN